LPPGYVTTNEAVDPVFRFILGACIVLLLGIASTIVLFVVRYRRSRSPEPTSSASGSFWLEAVWITLPTALVMAMFWYGWAGYLSLRAVPKGALEVTATARQWSWSFAYANGRTSPKLYVPVGKPVRVELVSADVIHGFFVPAFRVKRDVVPGMRNHAWFTATRAGSYDLFCSSYCGVGHSAMITTVEALPEKEFDAWLSGGGKAAKPGPDLLREHGCLGCHSLDGSRIVGPSFKGLYESKVRVAAGGKVREVKADDAYLRESITDPGAKVVEGYGNVMPTYGSLPPKEIDALVEAVESVK
jgi:cytochrome c oxidase subunit 2